MSCTGPHSLSGGASVLDSHFHLSHNIKRTINLWSITSFFYCRQDQFTVSEPAMENQAPLLHTAWRKCNEFAADQCTYERNG
ncbi:hypothetical protein QL093DRAFT_2478663 [Fusarium oxysporum]|nr:hypothetical protein QL093DRAFT_2478663 [Fusarium oxysporum]